MPEPLDYSPVSPHPSRGLKNAYLRLAMVMLAAALLFGLYVIAPSISRHNELTRLQSKFLNYAAAAHHRVFQFDASDLSGATVQPFTPSALWMTFNGLLSGNYGTLSPILYLHRRDSPSGQKLLICVRVISRDEQGVLLERNAVRPGGWISDPVILRSSMNHFPLPAKRSLVIYAGQSDPRDPSHFTIAYSADHTPGVIDGWVGDHGEIHLQSRNP